MRPPSNIINHSAGSSKATSQIRNSPHFKASNSINSKTSDKSGNDARIIDEIQQQKRISQTTKNQHKRRRSISQTIRGESHLPYQSKL